MAERFNTRWLLADHEAGDIVLHSPFMIHASTTNQSIDRRLRLKADLLHPAPKATFREGLDTDCFWRKFVLKGLVATSTFQSG